MRTRLCAVLSILFITMIAAGCIGVQQTVPPPPTPIPPTPTAPPPTEAPTLTPTWTALPTATPEPSPTPSPPPTEELPPATEPPVESDGGAGSAYADPTVAVAYETAQAVAPLVVEAMEGSGASLDAAWDAVYDLPPGFPFQLTVSQAEIDAKITMALAASPTGGENVEDVAVTLDNGLITVGLMVKTGPRSVSGSVVVQPSIDSEGRLVLTVISATLGPVSVPPEMLSMVNVALEQAIVGARDYAEVEVVLTGLAVDDGFMTVSGFVAPS